MLGCGMAIPPRIRCHCRHAINAQRPSPRGEGRHLRANLHLFGKGLARIFFDAGATGAKPVLTVAS